MSGYMAAERTERISNDTGESINEELKRMAPDYTITTIKIDRLQALVRLQAAVAAALDEDGMLPLEPPIRNGGVKTSAIQTPELREVWLAYRAIRDWEAMPETRNDA